MVYAVVRLRGQANIKHDVAKTLESLRLHRVNHATLVPDTDEYDGMLRKVEHFVTYGEPSEETTRNLLAERGRVIGDDPLTDEEVSERTGFDDLDTLAEALVDEEVDIARLDGIKPVFRLAPARGGVSNTKRHVKEGGSLGYRGEAIDDLLERML